MIIPLVARTLIILGTIMLAFAVMPIRNICLHLPAGKIRNNWFLLIGLTILFMIGYIGFGLAFWNEIRNPADLIVPSIFFSGSIFVWLSSVLSLQTTREVRRVTMLEQEDDTDPITGVFNRRYIDRRLHQELARAENFKHPFAILLIEVDNFTSLNEYYGQKACDNLVVQMSSLCMATIRTNDVVGRYDTCQFMIIMPSTETSEAQHQAVRLRHIVENKVFETIDENNIPVSARLTVTIGVCSHQSKFDSVKTIILAVNQALLA